MAVSELTMQNMKKGKGFFLVGTVLGGLFGLLFAQRKGEDLRKELKESYKREGWQGNLKVAKKEGQKIAGDVQEVVEDVKQSDKVQELVKKGKQKAGELEKIGKKRAEEFMSSVSDKANDVIDKFKKDMKQGKKKKNGR